MDEVYKALCRDGICLGYDVLYTESIDWDRYIYNPSLIRGLLTHIQDKYMYPPSIALTGGVLIEVRIPSSEKTVVVSDSRLQLAIGKAPSWSHYTIT